MTEIVMPGRAPSDMRYAGDGFESVQSPEGPARTIHCPTTCCISPALTYGLSDVLGAFRKRSLSIEIATRMKDVSARWQESWPQAEWPDSSQTISHARLFGSRLSHPVWISTLPGARPTGVREVGTTSRSSNRGMWQHDCMNELR